jgi:hypothetical protein
MEGKNRVSGIKELISPDGPEPGEGTELVFRKPILHRNTSAVTRPGWSSCSVRVFHILFR